MESTKDEFSHQTAGTLMVLRVIIVAMLKMHPEPNKLLDEIKALLNSHGVLEGNLPAPIQAAFDERMQEMTSHLYERLQKP